MRKTASNTVPGSNQRSLGKSRGCSPLSRVSANSSLAPLDSNSEWGNVWEVVGQCWLKGEGDSVPTQHGGTYFPLLEGGSGHTRLQLLTKGVNVHDEKIQMC